MHKRYDVAVGGLLVADLRHPVPEQAEEIVRRIQPGISEDTLTNLIPIPNKIPASLKEEWKEFVMQAHRTSDGFCLGGNVPNSGMPLKYLLGEDSVALVANIGKGLIGKLSKLEFEKLVKKNLFLKEVDEDASYTVVFNKGRAGVACHHEGSNADFGRDLDITPFQEARSILLGYPPAVANWREGDNFRNFVKPIYEAGTRINLDMCAIREATPAAKSDWHRILSGSLPYIEGFFPSLNEAVFIYNQEFYAESEFRAKEKKQGILEAMTAINPEILRNTAEYFLRIGAKRVALTCGIEGAYMRTGEEERYAWRNREVFVNALKENRKVDTIGAGDNSKALMTFCSLRDEEYGPVATLLAGVAAGALNVEHKGSFGGFKTFREIQEAMRREPIQFNPGAAFTYNRAGYYVGSRDRQPIAA